MIGLKIKNIKEFMQCLLGSEAFDAFYLEGATIVTGCSYTIDGRRLAEYYPEETTDFVTWRELRPVCYTLIKGPRTPISFKVVLHAGPHYMEKLKKDPTTAPHAHEIKALTLTLHYEKNSLRCVTGTSYTTFVMDKTIDNLWDSDFVSSLTALGISFEIVS